MIRQNTNGRARRSYGSSFPSYAKDYYKNAGRSYGSSLPSYAKDYYNNSGRSYGSSLPSYIKDYYKNAGAQAGSGAGGGGGGSWGSGGGGGGGGGGRGGGGGTTPTPTPPPVRSTVNIDITPNRQVGTPAGVKAAEADRVAALAALAAQQRQQELALRDEYSQNLLAAQSSAADIYGGRAPAIFGQAVTGARRNYISGRSQQVQESISERAALKRSYDEAIRQAYVAAAQQAQQDAYNRAQLALMASQTMGY